ncbi:MAG: hypothetical protein CML69_00905 [Rhodobacteraceae bacterium]|nr:hypothetical protein [Paracoccaceae bacterium]
MSHSATALIRRAETQIALASIAVHHLRTGGNDQDANYVVALIRAHSSAIKQLKRLTENEVET